MIYVETDNNDSSIEVSLSDEGDFGGIIVNGYEFLVEYTHEGVKLRVFDLTGEGHSGVVEDRDYLFKHLKGKFTED